MERTLSKNTKAKGTTTNTTTTTKKSGKLTCEERHRLISEAAYLRAAARGFTGDNSVEDWLEAEQEVDRRYS